jgi:hypothetical protein
MFDYKVRSIAQRFFQIIFVIVLLACCPSYSGGSEALPLDDPDAVVQRVLSALKNIELPATGRGTAVMETENYRHLTDKKELVIDFVFMDQTSRTDIFESRRGFTGSRLLAHVVSDKYVIKVHPSGADIGRFPRHRDRNIGLDFHPEVFMQFKGTVLTKKLENILKYMGQREHTSVELDDKGILHIVCRGQVAVRSKDEVYNYEERMSFDTSRGLMPVLLKSTTETPERTGSTTVRLQWAKYDSAWYPSRAEYVSQPGNRFHRVVTIESFTPDADEKEFILDWLDVPDGMNVVGAGKRRWYKSPFRPAEDPEIPLEEIDFVQKIREQQSSAVNKADADDTGKAAANGLYLRDYQTGRLIGPVSRKPGSLLPPLDKETYIIANPTGSELEVRKRLLESVGYESAYFDCEVDDVVETIQHMLKHRMGDKAPAVQIEDVNASITMNVSGKEPAYDVFLKIAAKAKARIFIEDGAVILSRNKLREMSVHGNL